MVPLRGAFWILFMVSGGVYVFPSTLEAEGGL